MPCTLETLLVASLRRVMYPTICGMSCTGCHYHNASLFRVSAFVWRSLVGTAPAYLQELCRSISANIGRRPLRSAVRGDLSVPFARTSTMQHRAFSVVGPSIWNGLPLYYRAPSPT